jgi:hypothetical protein
MIPNFINGFGIIVDQNKRFAKGKQTFYLLIDMVTFADSVRDRGKYPVQPIARPSSIRGNAHTSTEFILRVVEVICAG